MANFTFGKDETWVFGPTSEELAKMAGRLRKNAAFLEALPSAASVELYSSTEDADEIYLDYYSLVGLNGDPHMVIPWPVLLEILAAEEEDQPEVGWVDDLGNPQMAIYYNSAEGAAAFIRWLLRTYKVRTAPKRYRSELQPVEGKQVFLTLRVECSQNESVMQTDRIV